jgi:glycerol-3-phosphate acyltransferase PlsY
MTPDVATAAPGAAPAVPVLWDGLALAAVAYFLGAIPFGYLVGWWRGVDIRASGSGNIGATNAARVLGKKWGLFVLALDAAKGCLPVLAALYLLRLPPGYVATVGLAAFVGHVFPVYLAFKGGKGVATAAGVLGALAPLAALAGFLVYAACYARWRISSVGSLAGLATVIPVMLVFYPVPAYGLLMGAMAALVVFTHRGNIKRLLKHEESKV